MIQIKLWWLCRQLRQHRQYQREDIDASIVEADICRDLLRRINELTEPVVVEQPAVARRMLQECLPLHPEAE